MKDKKFIPIIKSDSFYLFYEGYSIMSTKSDGLLARFHFSSFTFPPCIISKAEGMEERVRVLEADLLE
jgi:hypothetical protein